MIVHQHEGVHAHPEQGHRSPQQLAEVPPIPVVPENRPALVAPGRDVIPPAHPLNPQGSGHAPRYPL